MQGVGRTREPFLFNIACIWLVRIVGTFLCTRLLGLGLVSAWGCMIAHNLLLFFPLSALLCPRDVESAADGGLGKLPVDEPERKLKRADAPRSQSDLRCEARRVFLAYFTLL